MRVAFDSQIFRLQETGGISKYFAELVAHLRSSDPVNSYILYGGINNNRHLIDSKLGYKGANYAGLAGKLTRNRFYNISETVARNFERTSFSQNGFDIVHYTYYGYEYYKAVKEKKVITIHDLIYEKFPSEFEDAAELLTLKKASVLSADHIICISENTKNDLLEYYEVDKNKLSVIYHGVAAVPFQKNKKLNDNYILFVGKRGGYKNFERAVQAFSGSELKKKFKLVCFGGGPFDNKEEELIEINNLKDQVVYLTGDDSTLNNAYQHAFFLIYPSLYEGFGLPVIEAMINKCPVICSNSSSLPEIAGDAALSIDTNSIDEISKAMELLFRDSSLRKDLINKGEINAKRFTWESTANKTREVYLNLLKK